MEAESHLGISHSGLASRHFLHAFHPGLSQIRRIPIVIYTIPQLWSIPAEKVHLSSLPISLLGVKCEFTLGTSMGFGRWFSENTRWYLLHYCLSYWTSSFHIVKGGPWQASLLASGQARSNIWQSIKLQENISSWQIYMWYDFMYLDFFLCDRIRNKHNININ